ncbi:MAG: hypothetical protein ACFFB0_19810 [Promethearchaeota archaeon]
MPDTNLFSQRDNLIEQINELLIYYEKKAECGIFFILDEGKSPLDIIGVLDFLKYKIKKWGNTNIFSYIGNLFENNTVLVVGARDLEEAKSIIIYMLLSKVLTENKKIDDFLDNQTTFNNLQQFLNTEFTKNITTGYPVDPTLERKLRDHLEKLIMS